MNKTESTVTAQVKTKDNKRDYSTWLSNMWTPGMRTRKASVMPQKLLPEVGAFLNFLKIYFC